MNDLSFGATLVACLATTVITVWMELGSASPARTDVAAATAQRDGTPRQAGANHDKACTARLAVAPLALN